MSIVYLNGEFLPLEQACVSVLDRGFLFGDGIYEVIPVYAGRLFRLSHHLERLQNSLVGIRLANPLGDTEWTAMLQALLKRNCSENRADSDHSIYLQITRGPAPRRDHAFPAAVTPTVFASCQPIPDADPDIARRGISAVTLDDTRWSQCHIKAITLLPNVLLRQEAIDREAAEAILIRAGMATEGSASNLFIVQADTLLTPPKGPQLLPGITRDLVLELARKHHLPCEERSITTDMLNAADEIWITSSTREIAPVTRLDGKPVGGGVPGPHWQTMVRLYRQYKDDVRNGLAA